MKHITYDIVWNNVNQFKPDVKKDIWHRGLDKQENIVHFSDIWLSKQKVHIKIDMHSSDAMHSRSYGDTEYGWGITITSTTDPKAIPQLFHFEARDGWRSIEFVEDLSLRVLASKVNKGKP